MADNDRDRGTESLYTAAKNRMSEALDAWLQGDFDRVASSAPLAVELLAKAGLWSVDPTLLLPLETKHEAALLALATAPNLSSPSLRTIGLKIALGRLGKVFGDLPVPLTRQDRLVDCRNGAIHIGALPQAGENTAETAARLLLADALLLCTFVLGHLKLTSKAFYGDQAFAADQVLQERRSEVEHHVARLIAQADSKVTTWRAHVDNDDIWESTALDLQDAAANDISPELFGAEMGAITEVCPNCGYEGRLLGRVDVEDEVDWDREDGEMVPVGYWRVWFYPRAFACNVCKLVLREPAELSAAYLPAELRELEEAELGDDFSASEWAQARYGTRD